MKAIIFDQDGTLYPRSSDLGKKITLLTKLWFQRSLNIPTEKIEEFYSSLPNKFPLIYDAIKAYGLSLESYFRDVFDSLDLEGLIDKNEELISFLKSVSVPVYIVTLAPLNYSKRLQSSLGIFNYVSQTFCVYNFNPMKKITVYEYIRGKIVAKPNEMLVVGDNFETDIKEAQQRGYDVILISKHRKIRQTFSNINDFIKQYTRIQHGNAKK